MRNLTGTTDVLLIVYKFFYRSYNLYVFQTFRQKPKKKKDKRTRCFNRCQVNLAYHGRTNERTNKQT